MKTLAQNPSKDKYACVTNTLGHRLPPKMSKNLLGIVHLIIDELLDGKHPTFKGKNGVFGMLSRS